MDDTPPWFSLADHIDNVGWRPFESNSGVPRRPDHRHYLDQSQHLSAELHYLNLLMNFLWSSSNSYPPQKNMTKSIRPYTTDRTPQVPIVVLDIASFGQKMQALVTQLPDLSAVQLLQSLTDYYTKDVFPVMLKEDSAGENSWKRYFVNVSLDEPEEWKKAVIAVKDIFRYLVDHHYKEMLDCKSMEMMSILCNSIECIIVLADICRDFGKILASKFPFGQEQSLVDDIRRDRTILLRRYLTCGNVQKFVNHTPGTKLFVKKRITKLLNQPDRIQQTDAFSPFSSWNPLWSRLRDLSSAELLKHYDGQCPVCLEDVDDDPSLAITDGCSHVYCVPCFEKLACSARPGQWTCPNCRSQLTNWTTKKVFEDHLRLGWEPAQVRATEELLLNQAGSVVIARPEHTGIPSATGGQLPVLNSVAGQRSVESNVMDQLVELGPELSDQNNIADVDQHYNDSIPINVALIEHRGNRNSNTQDEEHHHYGLSISFEDNIPYENQGYVLNAGIGDDNDFHRREDYFSEDDWFESNAYENHDHDVLHVLGGSTAYNDNDDFSVTNESEEYDDDGGNFGFSDDIDYELLYNRFENIARDESFDGVVTDLGWINRAGNPTDRPDHELRSTHQSSLDGTINGRDYPIPIASSSTREVTRRFVIMRREQRVAIDGNNSLFHRTCSTMVKQCGQLLLWLSRGFA